MEERISKVPKITKILSDNRGITTVEIILILVVLLALVFIFRDQLIEMISEVAAKAVTMRERKYDDDSVHDETLEEIEKKEPQAD